MKYKKYFYIIITLLVICFIFSFSLHDAQASSAMSDKVGEIILKHFSIVAENVSWDEVSNFNQTIRKWAHFVEFFGLGVLVYLLVRQTSIRQKVLASLAFCMLIGVMDELIQNFMDGRTSQFMDVLIDSCGGLVGIIIAKCMSHRGKCNSRSKPKLLQVNEK